MAAERLVYLNTGNVKDTKAIIQGLMDEKAALAKQVSDLSYMCLRAVLEDWDEERVLTELMAVQQ